MSQQDASAPVYELYYWPMLPGRGELVRLLLEDAGVPYIDVARLPEDAGGGVMGMRRVMAANTGGLPPFAPPFLKVGDLIIAHTANILLYLAPRLHLVPDDETSRIHAHQLQLSITDLVAEIHDTHHPVTSTLAYEEQKTEAVRAGQIFASQRMPRLMGYFEDLLASRPGPARHLLSSGFSYVDLSMFHVLLGLEYAFPRAFAHHAGSMSRLCELRDQVAARPRIAAYLASERRLPFTDSGIFRRYPELDLP